MFFEETFLSYTGLDRKITLKSCAVICSLRFFLSSQRQHFIKQNLTRLKAQLPCLRQYRRFKVYQFYFQFC